MASLVPNETTLEVRDASPAHYLIKNESYSLFDKHRIVKYETGEFEAGDWKWKLTIYPNGHKTGSNDGGYVSIYLAIADTTAQPEYWEVNAAFSICLFNQISDKYRYTIGRTRRFHAMKKEWGFSEFISKKDLTDPSNGYLIGDNCVFGAEVFVNRNKAVVDCVSLKNYVYEVDPLYQREFKIPNFSTLTGVWTSDEFTVAGCKWKIKVHPNGNKEETGRSASIYLQHVVSDNRNNVKASFTIILKNQFSDENHVKKTCTHWFIGDIWGWPSFVELVSLTDPNGGFIVTDCVLLEIELSLQAIVT